MILTYFDPCPCSIESTVTKKNTKINKNTLKTRNKTLLPMPPRRLVKAGCEHRTLAAFVLSLDDGEQMLAENVGLAGWLLGSLHLLTG